LLARSIHLLIKLSPASCRELATAMGRAGEVGRALETIEGGAIGKRPIYTRFTEGFATRDLSEARRLLDLLA
jgi:hypothetical protein